eukprot:scaffold10954_cov74-Cyclotella_meneghiniana.AAC.1
MVLRTSQARFSYQHPLKNELVVTVGDIEKSNLNLVSSYVILIGRHWNGPAAVNCLNSSKTTQSWSEKLAPQA